MNLYLIKYFQHEFPNFQVDVQVLVLQDDGSSLAAAITCAGLALADAAVPMYDLPVGLSKVIYNLLNQLIFISHITNCDHRYLIVKSLI